MATIYLVQSPEGYCTKKYSGEPVGKLTSSRDKAEKYKSLMKAGFIADELKAWYTGVLDRQDLALQVQVVTITT